jgi:peptidoglycan/xylan/chitin deacetylase (PgdA/CDA1 family)
MMRRVAKFFIVYISTLQLLWSDSHIFLLNRFDDKIFVDESISSKKLREDFNYLRNNGYKVVSLSYLLSHKYEDKLIAFTIDNGYRSFYTKALPVFREFQYPFTIFLYTGAVDDEYPDFMNWRQVKRASQFGEIALHGHRHKYLTSLDPISIMRDTQNSIISYKRNIHEPPKYYSYPYGAYDKDSREIIEAFGFKAIFNQSKGAVSSDSDQFNLPRIKLFGEHNIEDFLKIKDLPVKWIEPVEFPKDGKLRRVELVVPDKIRDAQIYLTGYTWKRVKANNGLIKLSFDAPVILKYEQTRIFVKTPDNRLGSITITKK